ncbi:hypothetical protein GCK72_022728 [Caenorhabditis remanei]|uniref:Uncharacterized protein n=1 Tax=Caenorhabditis remanei TaxID=31234 RepID=A0A6A5FUU3_CAERE|nr:hypothetical protein GCK72_022728 [Caenorhabditis remanei]KAF1746275.1 hypothetical protein GCK72_022728 [Caenorhabditis remanei]
MVLTMLVLPFALYCLRLAKIKREQDSWTLSFTKAKIRINYWAIIGEILVAVLFGYLPILLTYTSTILGLGKEEIGTFYLNYSICGSTVVEALPLIYLLKKPKVFASSVAVIPLSSSGRF